jgi:hemin uptake protein HemP
MNALSSLSAATDTDISPLPIYEVRDLTKCGDQAQIVLDGQVYTLRITRAGKLILTK